MEKISKDDFIKYIKSINIEYIEIELNIQPPANKFDLPDVRFGSIYSPVPFTKTTYIGKEIIEFTCRVHIE